MRRDTLAALCLMLVLLAAQAAIWLPLLPNETGRVSVDFSFWLPDLLAGYYWYVRNGLLAMPWFSPAECAGVPFHADPQVAFLSLPQFLAFVMPPLAAVRSSFVVYAACGYWGAWHLARHTFALAVAPSLLAASLFLLNGFFAVRMVVGHISYAPFMVAPALAAALLRPPGVAPVTQAEQLFRILLAGFIVAIMIEGGMVHIIPPLYLSLIAIGLIHALCFGVQLASVWRLAGATLAGAALCAGKLAAGLALLSHIPRDFYPLPGFAGPGATLYIALRSLFTPVDGSFGGFVVHSHIILGQHEFEYGVGPAPALLMLAAAGLALARWWRHGHAWPQAGRARWALMLALAGCLAVPVALNLYDPAWNALLKSLPFFGSSSNLLRWFSAWIIPAILGGALALQRLGAARRGLTAALAAIFIAVTVVIAGLSDHTAYGPPPDGLGFYDASSLDAAWHRAHDTAAPPPITEITRMVDQNKQLLMAPERQNGLAQGYSQLFCYAPLFGYRLERFPFGHIRLGDPMSSRNNILNFKNPACYVFPGANHCASGDQFTDAQSDALHAFLDYRPFPFAKPGYAIFADWLGIVSLLTMPLLLVSSGWRLRERQNKK